jgi:class 3 adenylate cyclase/tetratricopeptide (TPR) repeat protein
MRTAGEQTTPAGAEFDLLKPYVPRLLIEWLQADPSLPYREVDGSLTFADISGFTPLTERLARKGKVGAEEIDDILDECFTALLAAAYEYGAGLVQWGGDAVLLLFDGPEHEVRACRAAAGMQQTMRRFERLQTSAGLARLRMSIGIESGAFAFFAVGDLHRELVLAGRAASRTVLMEQIAGPGEIALGKSTAAAIERRFHGRERGEAILLRGVPDAPSRPAQPVPTDASLDLAQCLPLGIREHVLAGGEPEHRAVTAAFVMFEGTDALLEREGPAALAEILDDCLGTIQREAARHDVTFFETDVAGDGGKVMLIAGAPRSSGNDEERMLRALRAIVEAPTRLTVRAGVNAGRVFAGDFGPPYRRTYSVKGDAVNLAARLAARARPGQIVATGVVLDRSRTLFETEELEPFRAKGKSAPVQAWSVGPPTGAREEEAASTPLVGRERELRTLLAAIADARELNGQVVELIGEPGMGKSRLLEEAIARGGELRVVTGVCEEYESSTPYFPVRQLLVEALGLEGLAAREASRRLTERVREVAPHLVPWLPVLAIPLELVVPPTPESKRLDPRFVKTRVEETTRDLLALALPTPTLLVFEDAHWLDEASRDLLVALVEGIEDRPWVLVVTRRDEAAPLAGAESERTIVVRLEPLAEADAAALLDASTEQVPLPPHILAALAERSGGNPLFLSELVGAARQAGDLETLPESIEGLLAAQIDRLSPRDRTILRYAAVLGVSFGREQLAAALEGEANVDDDELWRRLGGLVRVDASGVAHFRHGLVRDAAYEGLPYRRRRELHARVGETIERLAAHPEEEAARLSLHFFHAQRFEKAWEYSLAAGRQAQTIYANVEAVAFYQRALEAARRVPAAPGAEAAAVWEALGDVRVRLGEFGQAGLAYRNARRQARADPAEEAGLLLKEALVPWRLGRYPQALRWINRGLRLLDGADRPDAIARRARLHAWHGVIRLRQGRPLEAIDWCRLAISEAEQVGAKEALAHAYYVLDYAYFALGRYSEAIYSSGALAIYGELGNLGEQAGVLNNLGMFAYFQGSWDESIERYRQAEEAWERSGDRWSASFATVNRGEILSDQGKLDEAEPLFRYSLRVARASGTSSRIADIAAPLGRLLARKGSFAEARALLDEARGHYERAGARAELIGTDARIVECLVLAGDAEEALALAQSTLARAGTVAGTFLAIAMLERLRGRALTALGRLDEARAALETSLEEARAKGADYEIALGLDALIALERRAGPATKLFEEELQAICARLGVSISQG